MQGNRDMSNYKTPIREAKSNFTWSSLYKSSRRWCVLRLNIDDVVDPQCSVLFLRFHTNSVGMSIGCSLDSSSANTCTEIMFIFRSKILEELQLGANYLISLKVCSAEWKSTPHCCSYRYLYTDFECVRFIKSPYYYLALCKIFAFQLQER